MFSKPSKPKSQSDLNQMRKLGDKLAWITAYDFPSAYCSEKAGVDMILVGDSGAMVQYGMSRTSGISMELMIEMCKAVRIGAPNTLAIGDMPRGSYEISSEEAVRNALRFAIQGECDFVKLEGASESILDRTKSISEAGVPVIGHIGLTPQSLGVIANYKVVGRVDEEIGKLKRNVLDLTQAGVACILLEAVPPNVAAMLREISTVPIYGIGAGPEVDGQLLIYHDVIGYFPRFRPKFARLFAAEVLNSWRERRSVSHDDDYMVGGVGEVVEMSIRLYVQSVKSGAFPDQKYCYPPINQEFISSIFPNIKGNK